MRILFITPELPNRLHRIRALTLLRGLAGRHEIDLVSLAHQQPAPATVAELQPLCRRVDWVLQPRWRSLASATRGLLSAAPLEACYERSPELARLVTRRLAERSYDLVYVKRLRMAQYAPIGLPRVLDLTDSMARFYDLGWRRAPWPAKALFLEEWLKHRAYEPRQAARFARCLVASPVDAAYLRRAFGLDNVVVVPNAVDTEYFCPRSAAEPAGAETFVLSGLMDKLVNVDAAQYACSTIWPLVRRRLPTARLRLVGPKPSRAVRALDGRDEVRVVGFVPDVRDEIASATAVLVPLRVGTGTKNKVLQALAMARPVVTTSVGNEGLDAMHGEHLLVADEAEGFADGVVALSQAPARRRALGEAGRAWVTERYGVDSVTARLERVLEQVAAG